MARAILSIGSNLGDRMAHLSGAVTGLGEAVLAVSSVYRTPPWGPEPQPDYYNAVVLVDDEDCDAMGWLQRCRALEAAAHRKRDIRWGPRTLDVDVIVVDDVRSADPELTLPHPRAHERAFVLVPWAEIDPAATLPGLGEVADLLAGLPPEEVADIARVGHVH